MSFIKKENCRDPKLLLQIWTSAYGAAYVADFRRMRDVTDSFDKGLEHADAEAAEVVADRAVEEWIRWNEEGKE